MAFKLGICLNKAVKRTYHRAPTVEEITYKLSGATDNSHTKVFNLLKKTITESVILNYFKPEYNTKIQVDASGKGLGAALIQTDPAKPDHEYMIAFASKSLSDVEQRYANIEREMLAVVFGIERFHTYVYGSSFQVESDHKPLENIVLKNLAQAPPRLQRMLLRLQHYDFVIHHRKGSEMQLADFLSRFSPKKAPEIEMEHTIHSVQWSEEKLTALREETATDSTLSFPKSYAVDGPKQLGICQVC